MENHVLKQAEGLRQSLEAGDYKYEALVSYMQKLNWKTIDYNDDDKNDAYLKAMGMYDFSQAVDAFFYRGSNGQFIAINRKSRNKLELFAHELGHIYRGHETDNLSEKEEQEADEFADYLLNGPPEEVTGVQNKESTFIDDNPSVYTGSSDSSYELGSERKRQVQVKAEEVARDINLFIRKRRDRRADILCSIVMLAITSLLVLMMVVKVLSPNIAPDSFAYPKTAVPYKTEASKQTVYWTLYGNKYHSTNECPTLKNAVKIFGGDISLTDLEPCSVCNK